MVQSFAQFYKSKSCEIINNNRKPITCNNCAIQGSHSDLPPGGRTGIQMREGHKGLRGPNSFGENPQFTPLE